MPKLNGPIGYLIISATLLIIACSKESQPSPVTDRNKLLTETNWQLTNEFYEKKGDASSRVDLFTTDYAECERDDIYRFQPNGMLYRSDSTYTCEPGYHPYGFFTGGTWNTNAKVDTMGLELFMAFKYLFKIQKLDQNSLELRQDQKDYFDEDVSYTWRFKAVR